MDPQLTQSMLAFLAGHGLSGFAASLEKLKKVLSGETGTAGGKRPVPQELQAMLAAQAPHGVPPAGAGPSPAPNMPALAQLLAARGGQ